MSEDFILKVKNFALKNSEKGDIHGFPHVDRVYELSVNIGWKLNANTFVLKVSALLHDIGRIKEKIYPFLRNHANFSADMALEFLKSQEYPIAEKDIENIIHSIKAHSFSNNIKPETLEAKILSDADKLDALGAIGLYRTIGFTVQNEGGIERVISHLENKILQLDRFLFLGISRKIAKERVKIIKDFYDGIRMET